MRSLVGEIEAERIEGAELGLDCSVGLVLGFGFGGYHDRVLYVIINVFVNVSGGGNVFCVLAIGLDFNELDT